MRKKQSDRELLQSFPLFRELNAGEIDFILDLTKTRQYHRGSHIFMQNDPLTDVYFIHEGTIKIYKTDYDGNEQIVNILKDGDMFPHQGFFRQDDYPANAQVLDETLLVNIPIRAFEDFLVTNPEISIKMFRVLGDIIVDLQQRLEEQILHNTYEQIIMLLLRLSDKHGSITKDGSIRMGGQFTNRQLANMIGSSRETVSRTLTQLKKQGFISNDQSGSLTIDAGALEDALLKNRV